MLKAIGNVKRSIQSHIQRKCRKYLQYLFGFCFIVLFIKVNFAIVFLFLMNCQFLFCLFIAFDKYKIK